MRGAMLAPIDRVGIFQTKCHLTFCASNTSGGGLSFLIIQIGQWHV